MTNDFPRRACLDRMTPAERAIYDAVQTVELAGADVRLTDAVILLQAARDSVADFVDGISKRRSVHEVATYPCGCSASGGYGPLPNYCAEHGGDATPPQEKKNDEDDQARGGK